MSGYNSVTQGYLGGGSSGGGPATSVPISGLTAAVATNAIDNAGYAQGWNWDSLSLNKALSLSANTSLAAGNAQTILAVELSGANANSTQTTYAAQFSNTHTGTASTNVAAKFTASGGTANIAIQASGIVAITSPVVNGTGVSAGLSIIANSLTTGNGVDISTTSLRTGTVMKLTSSGTALQSTTSNVLSIISSGVNVNNGVTATGATISVTNTNVTSGTNVGLSITATGATTANYALKLVDGSQGVSKVLTSDANGNASWQTPAGSSLFPLTGTGTATGSVTGDLASNTLSIMNGNVGIGIAMPTSALQVYGNIDNMGVGDVTFGQGVSRISTNSTLVNLGDLGGSASNEIFTIDASNKYAYYDNNPHDTKFGINTSTPSVALDVVGAINIDAGSVTNNIITTGLTQIGDITGGSTGLSIDGQSGADNITYSAVNGHSFNSTIRFSSYGAGALTTDGSGNITAVSDRRVKHDIKPFTMGIKELRKLSPSTFIYNQDSTNTVMPGFIAQDVEKAFNGVGIGHDKAGMLSLNTNVVLAALVNAVNDQQKKIEVLQSQNKQLLKQLGSTGNRNK